MSTRATTTSTEQAARDTAAKVLYDARAYRDEWPVIARHEGTWSNPAHVVTIARARCEHMASMYLSGGYNTSRRQPFDAPDLDWARRYARAADLLAAVYVRVLDVRDAAKVAA